MKRALAIGFALWLVATGILRIARIRRRLRRTDADLLRRRADGPHLAAFAAMTVLAA
jgi:hypothetical protein